ncbi:MAG: 16S rRNA (guanine(527)-N(7))-methyltransferase RsmG [Puniceicoccales bacterium]|nr:16S rRNA (guanine(527)-N(7))-methyltransferase RsmG [Puniceicoccales bacterium]
MSEKVGFFSDFAFGFVATRGSGMQSPKNTDAELIGKVFCEISGEKISKLLEYAGLLREWNTKINLVSRKDVGNIVRRHVIPSLAMAVVWNFPAGGTVLDIGTGGGLPGIPMAIVHGTTNFTLLDSIGKKVTAVRDMISRLELENTIAENARAEDFCGKFDTIVARAVTNVETFVGYGRKLLKTNGRILYLKGGDCSDDLRLFQGSKIHSIAAITGMEELSDKVILEIF